MQSDNIVLGKKDKAPLNRSTLLTRADVERFARLPSVAEMASKSFDDLLNTIFVGDCLEGMRQLPSACVDFIFADPPYNLGKNFGNNLDRRPDHEYRRWWSIR